MIPRTRIRPVPQRGGAALSMLALAVSLFASNTRPGQLVDVAISPTQGAVGTAVVISGTGFGAEDEVAFGGVDAPFVVNSGTRITTQVPNGAVSGPITIRTAKGPIASTTTFTVIPIEHVVVIYQENHTFDNVLGLYCARHPDRACDGATTGMLSNGSTIPLALARDVVPGVVHSPAAQRTAIDGGRMDGFDRIRGCLPNKGYRCYSQYDRAGAPALWMLADDFAISDRTFSQSPVPSWSAHVELVSATLDGFAGWQPTTAPDHVPAPGWGCDSFKVAQWVSPLGDISLQPACVPEQDGTGPYRPSPVPWVPTIMDRLDQAGLSWRIYAAGPFAGTTKGYGWAVCPSFADCLDTGQRADMVPFGHVLDDAGDGTLPSLSLVMPSAPLSQHNGDSMIQGDNWIASVVNAVGQGPDWSTTAIFIVYDDCGCFYDHVRPPDGLGPRVPMVIVSPYARVGFTDSQDASLPSMLAYVEHVFGLPPLSSVDATAYDFSDSFNYAQLPLGPVTLPQRGVPKSSLAYVRRHADVRGET